MREDSQRSVSRGSSVTIMLHQHQSAFADHQTCQTKVVATKDLDLLFISSMMSFCLGRQWPLLS